jgi:hypothetical protein
MCLKNWQSFLLKWFYRIWDKDKTLGFLTFQYITKSNILTDYRKVKIYQLNKYKTFCKQVYTWDRQATSNTNNIDNKRLHFTSLWDLENWE